MTAPAENVDILDAALRKAVATSSPIVDVLGDILAELKSISAKLDALSIAKAHEAGTVEVIRVPVSKFERRAATIAKQILEEETNDVFAFDDVLAVVKGIRVERQGHSTKEHVGLVAEATAEKIMKEKTK